MEKSISERNIRLYYIISFLDSLVFTLPIIILFLKGVISPVQISFVYGFRYFIQLISELPTGAIADLLGKKVSLFLSYGCFFLSYFLLPFVHHFWQVLALYTLLGFASSFLSGAQEALVYDSLLQDKKQESFHKVQVKQNTFFQIGLAVSSILGGFMYSLHPSIPFIAFALCSLLAMFLTTQLIEPFVDSEVFSVKGYVKQMKTGSQQLFQDNKTTILSLLYIAVGGITWTCATYFNAYMFIDIGYSDRMAGYLQGGLRLLNLLFLNHLFASSFFTKKRSILFFPLTMILALLPGIFLTKLSALPFIQLSMIAATARWVILGKYTNEVFASKYRATAISALSFGVGIVYVLLTISSGPIIQYFGGIRTIYTLLGVLSVVTVLPLSVVYVKKYVKENG
jgi:MFS family permease